MNQDYQFRAATPDDARDIARLIEISSDGVAVLEWQQQAQQEGCTALDIGERTYRQAEGDYSYRHCTIVEKDNKVAGMLLSFGIPNGPGRDQNNRPDINNSNVFAPYMYLEEPNSWYICGVALFPEHRGQGIGSSLMQLASKQARTHGHTILSLVVFEQNEASVRLYKKLGYRVVDHAPVIPHPLIHYTGNALLMIRTVE